MKIFWKENSGQVSVELLIIIAAVLAVAIILVTQLNQTASTGADTLNQKSTDVINKINGIA